MQNHPVKEKTSSYISFSSTSLFLPILAGFIIRKPELSDKLNNITKKKAAEHPAFKKISKLEVLHYTNIRLHFLPKFQFELNPIEKYWANLKWFFWKHNEQSIDQKVVLDLILKARDYYKTTETNGRIFSRFWRVVTDYNFGEMKNLLNNPQTGVLN
ncbi:hypothetical protein BpHYR1_049243 [Brachionus plicatilis]|uniref:Tc1-like transposase DDE domain-containing protein n=1 Tax=Brachionus plicatilis TaxID=10195 RepID=A0A3M7QNW2_BRAPC|nr:hypothetical protein BpHYR1_049243 [Brachionus plicatilis]